MWYVSNKCESHVIRASGFKCTKHVQYLIRFDTPETQTTHSANALTKNLDQTKTLDTEHM